MQALVGDRIVIQGHRVGEHDRTGVIRGVNGPGGSAPYVVEWSDREGQHLFWPGSDATIRHASPYAVPSPRP